MHQRRRESTPLRGGAPYATIDGRRIGARSRRRPDAACASRSKKTRSLAFDVRSSRFGVPVEYHKGELLGVQWDGGPISGVRGRRGEDAGSVPSRSLDIRAIVGAGNNAACVHRLRLLEDVRHSRTSMPEGGRRIQRHLLRSASSTSTSVMRSFDTRRRSKRCRSRLRRWRCGKSGNDSERATTRPVGVSRPRSAPSPTRRAGWPRAGAGHPPESCEPCPGSEAVTEKPSHSLGRLRDAVARRLTIGRSVLRGGANYMTNPRVAADA